MILTRLFDFESADRSELRRTRSEEEEEVSVLRLVRVEAE